MNNTAWDFQHAVVAEVSRESAWRFWSDVRNWAFDPSIEWVRLDGPFRTGTEGMTKPRAQEAMAWRLVEVIPCERAVIELERPGSSVRFAWQFESLAEGRTRLTQRIVAEGPDVAQFTEEMRESFAQGVREGMTTLASRMAEAAAQAEETDGQHSS